MLLFTIDNAHMYQTVICYFICILTITMNMNTDTLTIYIELSVRELTEKLSAGILHYIYF